MNKGWFVGKEYSSTRCYMDSSINDLMVIYFMEYLEYMSELGL